jgi:hypothetical protein
VAGYAPDVVGWDHKAVTIWKSAALSQGVSNLLAGIEVLVNAQFSVEFFKQQVSAVLFNSQTLTVAAFTDGSCLSLIYSIWRRQWCGR